MKLFIAKTDALRQPEVGIDTPSREEQAVADTCRVGTQDRK
jgi:hypothetical protein